MAQPDFTELNRLLTELRNNIQHATLTLDRQLALLTSVKVFGRDPTTATPIFEKDSIITLSYYGLRQPSSSASKEALRCLANAFNLSPPSRQWFVDLGCDSRVVEHFRDADVDGEFLCARILHLLTYTTDVDCTRLVHKYDLAKSIQACLERHAKETSVLGNMSMPQGMAVNEVLILMFNIQHFFPTLQHDFIGTLAPISKILLNTTWPSPCLQQPLSSIVNAILSLDLKAAISRLDQSSLISPPASRNIFDHKLVIQALIHILDQSTQELSEEKLDQAALPLCTLLRKILEVADVRTRKQMQQALLPTEQDREHPLGQGESLSARLLRLTTSSHAPNFGEHISNLLYELSDKDPDKLVHNIGFGFASGFLMKHKIAVPVSSTHLDSRLSSDEVNPVTGQKFAAERTHDTDLQEMTEEEKEREAERLFVLFERLKATGVVDVKNPVEQYQDQR